MEHTHHIVPRYKCKELDINPDFDDNLVAVTREQHALIHWGYRHNDLSPLLEICNPPQYVIDMIPLGDYRDASASVILAKGEMDGIEHVRGNEHPDYKPVLDIDGNEVEGSEYWSEKKRYYHRKNLREGKVSLSWEQREAIREEKKRLKEEKRIERENKRIEKKRIAQERMERRRAEREAKSKDGLNWGKRPRGRPKKESLTSLERYHLLRTQGIDPNKKYRENNRDRLKEYAKWYYHNVQKPKNELLRKQNPQ